MAAAWDHWTDFKLRLMSSAAAELYRWTPPTTCYPIRFEVTWDRVEEDREAIGGGLHPALRGWRANIDMTLETVAGRFTGSGITSPLETVIGEQVANAGSYLELYVAAVSPDGWTRVVLTSPWRPETLGKNAGLRVKLNFQTTAILTTAFPTRIQAFTSGGTA